MSGRKITRPARRRRADVSKVAYALFYCGTGLGAGFLAYAAVLSGAWSLPPANLPDKPTRIATIHLNDNDGKGRCRQVAFDNATGRFEEAGMGPCRNLIPDDLLVETERAREDRTQAIMRAFKR